MSRQTFPAFYPTYGSRAKRKPAVQITKFGDGYEARTAFGINTTPEVWDLTYEDSEANINTIDSFLKAQGAVLSFVWTTPDNMTANFVCRQWNETRMAQGVKQLTATFEQVFEA